MDIHCEYGSNILRSTTNNNVICFIGNWLLYKYVTCLIDIHNIYIYNICLFKQVVFKKGWLNTKHIRIIYKYKKNYLSAPYIQYA